MRVLIAEDEQRINSLVVRALSEQGCAVDTVPDGDSAMDLALHRHYDALVLDIMLPGRDGLTILRQLRERGNSVPVILLTARTTLNERLEGLSFGADDYVTKPFYVEELVARVQAVVRRAAGEQPTVLQVGDLSVNLLTREVRRGEQSIDLTSREFGLLAYLLRSPGNVFPRTQLLEHVWGYDFDPATNLVDVYIRRLRAKLEREGGEPLIETVRGVGYRVRAPQLKPAS